ncbi:MAG: TspO/MBR family protein [Methylocella sp.]
MANHGDLNHARRSIPRLGACLVLCAGVAAIGGLATVPQIGGWYAGLAKPPWTPPNSVFPIAWSILYFLMALSLWRLWDRATPSIPRRRALSLFMAQLALNAMWSPIFFGLHAISAGLAIILALVVLVAATILQSAKTDRLAAILLIPYLVWVCYAMTLNVAIAALNP